MVIAQDTGANLMTFSGDNAGWGWARIPLIVPAGAKRLDFVYRAWWNSIDATLYSGRVWNHMNCLGLLVDPAQIPELPASYTDYKSYAPTGFFGWCTTGWTLYSGAKAADRVETETRTTPNRLMIGHNNGSSTTLKSGLINGNGVVQGELTDPSDTTWAPHVSMPYGSSPGAVECRGFRIYADQLTKAMGAVCAVNSQSLTGDNMFNVFTSPDSGGIQNFQIHGDVTSAMRPDLATVVLPSALIIRMSHPALVFTFKEARYRFYDFNDNPL